MAKVGAWFRSLWPFGGDKSAQGEPDGVAPPPEAVPAAETVAAEPVGSEGVGSGTDGSGTDGGENDNSESDNGMSDNSLDASREHLAAFPDEFSRLRHVGQKPPSYSAQPSGAVDARKDVAGAVIPDTVVDGFAVAGLVVRAASIAGDSHRYGGEPRQDALAVVALGPGNRGLVLAVVADGVGSQPHSHVGAEAACKATVAALASRADDVEAALRGGLRDRLYFEVVHVIDEVATAIGTEAARLGKPGRELATTLRAVLVPTDPEVRVRLAFSVGDGATLRLAGNAWKPVRPRSDDDAGVHSTATAVLPLQPQELSVDLWIADPGETTVVCTDGLSEPLRDAQFAELLSGDWSQEEVPGMMRFLWQAQSRSRTYDDDRTVICIWESSSTSPAG
jgi:serine/threonine protein phosphatase PrpC